MTNGGYTATAARQRRQCSGSGSAAAAVQRQDAAGQAERDAARTPLGDGGRPVWSGGLSQLRRPAGESWAPRRPFERPAAPVERNGRNPLEVGGGGGWVVDSCYVQTFAAGCVRTSVGYGVRGHPLWMFRCYDFKTVTSSDSIAMERADNHEVHVAHVPISNREVFLNSNSSRQCLVIVRIRRALQNEMNDSYSND